MTIPEIQLHPHPTQADFILCEAPEVAILGPRREGKTDAGIMAMIAHAMRQPASVRPIPWVIIRDTMKNLRRSTLENLLSPLPGSVGEGLRPHLIVSDMGQRITLPGYWTARLFGIDSMGDISNLQGMNLGGVWLEEPAPAAINEIGHGVLERAWNMAQTSLSWPCKSRAQITSNYPDEDHWLATRFLPNAPARRLFRIPKGENPHLKAGYREQMAESLSEDPQLLRRLSLGEFGSINEGIQVTPWFNENDHVSDARLMPNPELPGLRFWDFGLTPACLLAQITPLGQLQIIDGWVGRNQGLRQFIDATVAPMLASPKWAAIRQWRDIGDPSGWTREQSDATITAGGIMHSILKAMLERGPADWPSRREAMHRLLEGSVGAHQPKLLISPQILVLRRGLRGAWHYKSEEQKLPHKNFEANACDALSYGAAILLPGADTLVPEPIEMEETAEAWMFRDAAMASTGRSGWMGAV